MIAVDTSALVAIVFGEPERAALRDAILRARKALISTASVLELKMVAYGRRGPRAVLLVDDLLRLPMFEITAPGPADLAAAFGAFVAFGKGADFAETDILAADAGPGFVTGPAGAAAAAATGS
jgi:ribonuclease VapC